MNVINAARHAVVFGLAALSLTAGPLVTYNFNGSNQNTPFAPSFVAAGITASNFTPNNISSDTQGCAANTIFCNGTARFGSVGTPDYPSVGSSYFSFTVSANPAVSLSDLSLNGVVYHQAGLRNGYVSLRSSADAFASNLAVFHITSGSTSSFATGLTGLLDSNPREFRLYISDDPSDGNSGLNSRIALDNVSLNTVPEPSTYLLMSAGLIAVAVAARRRRK